MSRLTIDQAVKLLKQGEIVAFPTETVYGLGARVFDENAVLKIFQAKKRPADNPLIVHISSLDQVAELAVDIPTDFYILADHFFPGPLTAVLKRGPKVPAIVSGGLDTIAIRMPIHSIARELIEKVGEPLAAPSANLSGRPSATEAAHVLEDFGSSIGGVIDGGEALLGIESSVVGLIDEPILLRTGNISREMIEKLLGKKIREKKAGDPAMSPGMKYRHYAPSVPLKLFMSKEEFLSALTPGIKRLVLTGENLSSRTLYRMLRMPGYDEIVVYCDEEIRKDPALMDRLTRAAGG